MKHKNSIHGPRVFYLYLVWQNHCLSPVKYRVSPLSRVQDCLFILTSWAGWSLLGVSLTPTLSCSKSSYSSAVGPCLPSAIDLSMGSPFLKLKGACTNQPFLYCQYPSLICHHSLPVVFQQPPDKSPWVCFCSWGTRLVHLGKLCDYGISSSLPSSNLEQWLPIVPHTDLPFFLWLGHCPCIFPKCYVYTHNVSSKKKNPKKHIILFISVWFSESGS